MTRWKSALELFAIWRQTHRTRCQRWWYDTISSYRICWNANKLQSAVLDALEQLNRSVGLDDRLLFVSTSD